MEKIKSYLAFLCCIAVSCFVFADNSSKIDQAMLLEKIREYQSPGSWAYKNISSQLKQFSVVDLSPNFMEGLFYNELKDPNHLICVARVKNNIPQVVPSGGRRLTEREEIILSAMRSLCQNTVVPDVLCLFSSHDSFEGGAFPVLTFSKKKSWKSMLMPDFEAMEGYGDLRARVKKSSSLYLWSSKTDKLFWRGATTGGMYNTENYALFPRSLAVLYSLDRPDLIDARFTNVVQDSPGVHELLQHRNMMGNFVGVDQSLKYKYLLDIDGNANTYSRCFWILLSNSVLFKIDSEYIQWYYSLMRENHNYVKILPDLSDLEEKVYRMKKNDRFAEQIALNGTRTAESDLSQEAILAYFFCFLQALAKLQ